MPSVYLLSKQGKKRLGFVLPPRTATRSIEHALKSIGGRTTGNRHDVNERNFKQCDVLIASIRNPFDVLVSWYHLNWKGEASGKTFEKWLYYVIGSDHRYLQFTTLPSAAWGRHFLRFEFGVPEQLNATLEHYGYPTVEVPHIGKSDRKPYYDYYNEDSRYAVETYYADDLTRFGYTFEGVGT